MSRSGSSFLQDNLSQLGRGWINKISAYDIQFAAVIYKQKGAKQAKKTQTGCFTIFFAPLPIFCRDSSPTFRITYDILFISKFSKGDARYSSPIPGGYAILAMSHFKVGNMEQANDYRKRFDEAIKHKAFIDDPKCKLFADEAKELFASQPDRAAVTAGEED